MLTPHFRIEEFVPEVIFREYGDHSIWFIDERLPQLAEFIRMRFGCSMTINNWLWGGGRNNSGFREPECTIGARLSDHKRGIALDIVPKDITPEEIRQDIISNFLVYRKLGLTTIEMGTDTWLHISLRYTGLNELLQIPLY